MAIRIGGRRRGPTPNSNPPQPQNSGLGQRARARIDAAADTMISQRQEAIIADGVPILAWRKRTPGSLPCTCTSGERTQTPDALVDDSGNLPSNAGVQVSNRGSTPNLLDDYEPTLNEKTNPFDLKAEPDFDPDFSEVTVESPDERGSGWISRVVEAGPFESGQSIRCPVCFGSSYTDAWKPYKAVRILGDLSEHVNWDTTGGELHEEAHPNLMVLQPGDSITWTLFIPRYFQHTVRSAVWNGMQTVRVTPEMRVNGEWVEATTGQLDRLQGTGGEIQFRLVATQGTLRLTHFEIIILLDDFVLANIPQIDIPYDSEFVDYNTTTTVDLPVDVNLNQGDVISEKKHGRVWVCTSVTKNRTAGGKIIDLTAQLRAVGSTEVYYNMDIFRPLHAG